MAKTIQDAPRGRVPDSAAAEGVVRSAGLVSAATMLSRITGLVRESVIAWLFGARMEADAYRLAFLLPNLTRDLFAEGALSSAFVPTFTEELTRKGREEAAKLANLVATAVILVVGSICVLGVLAAPILVDLFAPGFRATPGKTELAVQLTRTMFPFLLLVALAAQAMGVLNACNQFGVPSLAPTLFNIFSISSGLLLGYTYGDSLGISPIQGMAWGVLIGGICQLMGQVPSLIRQGFRFRPAFDWSHPGLRHIVKLMGPAILGGASVQINVFINTNLATHVDDPIRGVNGAVSWLNYAFRFFQLPLGLFGVALASATVPSIARSLASGQHDEFRRTLNRSLGVAFLMTVPSTVGLIVLGRDMITAVFRGGEFDAYDAHQTAFALSCYAVGLAAYSGAKILNPAFYALKDSRTPMLISMGSIAINFLTATSLLRYTQLGHAGLALSTSAVAIFAFLCQFIIMGRRVGGIHGRALLSSSIRMGIAALGMGVVISMMRLGIGNALGESRLVSLVALAVCVPGGLAVFYGLCRLLAVEEMELAMSGVLAPIRRVARMGNRD
ncbi:MAG: murein biosynthesis integral membrane protein MurJ [Bryobacteraceae bacterium]